METLVSRNQFGILLSRVATIHLKAKLDRFFLQKQNGIEDHSFRSDQLVC